MKIRLFQIDAFTGTLFRGNPAAVCILEDWPGDDTLQAIAAENNLSETAFLATGQDACTLRWFTPSTEIDLCGHATLAAAFVVFHYLNTALATVVFSTRSGMLTVERTGNLLAMDFPSRPALPCAVPDELVEGLGIQPEAVLLCRDYMAIVDSEETVRTLCPRMEKLMKLDCTGIIVTAPGKQADFVSRFFAPRVGVPEDPVTGSSHCTLVPYWSARLSKTALRAQQLSLRGGELFCEDRGSRVSIAGQAVLYMEGMIHL